MRWGEDPYWAECHDPVRGVFSNLHDLNSCPARSPE